MPSSGDEADKTGINGPEIQAPRSAAWDARGSAGVSQRIKLDNVALTIED